jgi:hypothetical protein
MIQSDQIGFDERVVKDEASQFYWALVDLPDEGPDLRRIVSPSSRSIHEDFLQGVLLPSPDSLVWAVCEAATRSGSATPQRRLLFCIQDRQRAVDVWTSGAIHYGPRQIPDSLEVSNEPSSINLLCGELTPKPLSRVRARRWLAVGALGVAVAASMLLGIERRRIADAAVVAERQGQLNALLRENRVGSVAELSLRRDRLRVTRQRLDRAGTHHRDAAAAIAALLAAWPNGDTAPITQTESVTVSGDVISMQAAFFDRQSATSLAQSLSHFPDESHGDTIGTEWTLGQPQITSVNGPSGQPSFRATFRFIRMSGGTVPSGKGISP